MCMEDFNLGRETEMSQKLVTVPNATSILLIDRNPNRVALVIGDPSASVVTISRRNDVTSGQGIHLNNGNVPMVLNIKDHGNIVTEEFYAIATAGTPTVCVWESILRKGKT